MATEDAPWRRQPVAKYYIPALIFATIPAHTGAAIYAASTPIEALSLIRVLAILAVGAALLAVVVHAVPGSDRTKGAALAFAVLVSGVYPPLAYQIGVPPCTWVDTALGMMFIALVAIGLQTMAAYQRELLDSSHRMLAVLAALVVAYGFYADVVSTLRANWDRGLEHPGGQVPPLGTAGRAPDIIHIVFDGLGSPDVLERTYGLNAEEIVSNLSEHGMSVEADAKANYVQTYLAMASLLSMDYLDEAAKIGRGGNDRTIAEAVIHDSAVIRALKTRGYRFTLLSSGYEAVARHPLADDGLFGPTLFTQLEGYVLPRTMFRVLPIAELTYVPQRGRTLWQLEMLRQYAPGPQPRFILVHLLLPHPPFTLTAAGESMTPPGVFAIQDGTTFPQGRSAYRYGYAEQARFALAELNGLLQRWSTLPHPPIVIAQGDHGPGLGYDFERPLNSNLDDRLSIFLGIRAGEWPIEPVTSPVNIYRALFDAVFGNTLTLLPDRSFVSSWSHPYDLTEVQPRTPSRSIPSPTDFSATANSATPTGSVQRRSHATSSDISAVSARFLAAVNARSTSKSLPERDPRSVRAMTATGKSSVVQ